MQIILKRYRKTLCHFCFKQLPPSPIPCSACAIPIYCDESCRHGSCGELSEEVEGRRWRGEHNHECGGASWSAVLPPDAVLALRLLSQSQYNEKLKIHVSVYLLVLNFRLCISYFLAFKGYFTLELKGQQPWQSKISHWWKRPRPSHFSLPILELGGIKDQGI